MQKVTVVLPCLNERDNIEPLIERLLRALPAPREILVVDDDSPDGTAEAVRGASARHPEVRLISRVGERGLASALQRGIDEASGDVVAWMDCDLSMPPEKLADLVDAVRGGQWDAAVGSRYIAGGGDRRVRGWEPILATQVFLGAVLSRAARLLFRGGFCDWTSGFIAVKKDVLTEIPLRGEHGEYFMRLALSLLNAKRRVVEIPYVFAPRNSGASKTAPSAWGLLRRGPQYAGALAESLLLSLRGPARGRP